LPRYYFTIRWADHDDIDPQGEQLTDDNAALEYACRLVERLKAGGGYDDPGLAVEARNEMRQRVLSIPVLPGCALRTILIRGAWAILVQTFGPKCYWAA
jgi:hypothetical protein